MSLNNDSLFSSSIGKSRNIKSFIMDSNVVVGVGNIYASESLFLAGISPKERLEKPQESAYNSFNNSIKNVLTGCY